MHYIVLGLLLLFMQQPYAADDVTEALSPPASTDGKGSKPSTPPDDEGSKPSTSPDGEDSKPPTSTDDDSLKPSTPDTLQTTIDVDGAQISLSIDESNRCILSITVEENEYDGLSDGVEETDTCGNEQTYTSSLDFNPKTARPDGFFCFKTPNDNYGWGKHNCLQINQFDYVDTGESIEIPVHEPPVLILREGQTEEAVLNKTVVYGEKLMISLRSESPQGYTLKYETRHAPIDTKIDNYNHILTWEARLLGRFRFDIIIREIDAKHPQELILNASVNVKEQKLSDYGLGSQNIINDELTAEDIENLPAKAFQAFRDSDIKPLRPKLFQSISAEQMRYMTYLAYSAISVQQFANLPPESLSSIRPASFGGFSSDVLFEFTTEHFLALDRTVVFGQLPGEDTSKIVTNLDLTKVTPRDINALLPPDWFFDGFTGELIVPGGTPITVRALGNNPAPPPRVKTPKLPKLDSNLALGGEATEDAPTILDSMNEALRLNNLAQFKFNQNADGIVKVADDSGVQFAFIPNNSSFSQEDDDVAANIQVDKGKLNLITAESQKLSLIPAPKDMTLLRNVLPNGDINMGDKGDIIFDYANVTDKRPQRDDTDVVVVCEFDAFVETIFDDYCGDNYDFYVCDDSFSDGFFDDSSNVRILRREGRLTRAGEYLSPQGKIAYEDTTAQTIYPAIVEPAIFLTMVHQIDGLDDVETYQNGAYLASFENVQYILQPDFTATTTPIEPKGQLIPPAINFNTEGGHLEYKVASNDIEYMQKVFIYPFLDNIVDNF